MTTSERLYPFQRDGVKTLLGQPAVLLADDMGLGKTVQTLAALDHLLSSETIQSALLVVPSPLLRQWRQELERWIPGVQAICIDGTVSERTWKWGLRKRVYLVSYDCLRNDLSLAKRREWDLVVLDEAQKIKSRRAHISRACKGLPRRRAWALTGTPLENHEDELASVLEFVRPFPIGTKFVPLSPGPRLRSLQAQLQLRRRKVDVLKDLPPKSVVRVLLELTPTQRRRYLEEEAGMTQQLAGLGRRANVMNVLQAITRLKQICNFCSDSSDSAKLQDLKARLSQLKQAGSRALVFSQWTSSEFGLARIRRELPEFKLLEYSGDLDLAERAARVRRFQEDPSILAMLISLRAGGQGLNLQAASYVFHFDRWWNPAVENQATDRSHRLGQQQPVTVYCYITRNTIEERIEAILQRKLALFAEVVDLVSLDPSRLLTVAELFGLVGLVPPPPASDSCRTALALHQRAVSLLEKNAWKLETRGAYTVGRRTDELGLPEELRLLYVDADRADLIKEFVSTPATGKKILLSNAPLRVACPGNVILWDAQLLKTLEGTR